MFITKAEASRCTQLMARYLPTIIPNSVIVTVGISCKAYLLVASCEFEDHQAGKVSKFEATVRWYPHSGESALEKAWIVHLEQAIREGLQKQGYIMPLPNPDETDEPCFEVISKVLELGKAIKN